MSTTEMSRSDDLASTGKSWYSDLVPAKSWRVWAGIARILIGFTFLWAFLDKNFGLGWATTSKAAWKFGTGDGSPTYGFLAFGSNPNSPLHGLYSSFADTAKGNPNAWVNWAFMLGLLFIGVALILGVVTRIASIAGVVLLLMMYVAEWPLSQITAEDGSKTFNNPLIDDHIINSVVLILLMLLLAGRHLGLGRWWESVVHKFPWLV